jgi:glycosyltransferase involved in cell wall biosynthesis
MAFQFHRRLSALLNTSRIHPEYIVTRDRYRFLFCIPTTQLSGGVKVVLTLAERMANAGHRADIFSWANLPEWYDLQVSLLAEKDIAAVDMTQYDFVVVSNAILIPMVLPYVKTARCVFLALDYEAFHHSSDRRFESFLEDSPVFKELYSLPVPIVATSIPIQRLVQDRIRKRAYLMPPGLNKDVFKPQQRQLREERKRILLVGNYLMPYKGMSDGLEALDLLSKELPVELVLITQEERGRRFFDSRSWPIEIHFCPAEADVPRIMSTCDVYCCTSWYEGLGLPALEAFCCGTPVVSTRSVGVDDYAEDGKNLLLADPNDPLDLARQLRRVLTDPVLSARLVEGGFKTVRARYDWSASDTTFLDAIADIDANYAGAGDVDPACMQSYIDTLERSGSFTPIEVFREFQTLAWRLESVGGEIADGSATSTQLEQLADLRDGLARFLHNERAQYYDAFKAKFDFCQLLLSCAEHEETQLVRLLMSGARNSLNRANASSLVEIRYTK